MLGNTRIAELLVATGAYRDLEEPVLLTSGELGIYYVNTEKLLQDQGRFSDYGDSSQQMIRHALQTERDQAGFAEVIGILTEAAQSFVSGLGRPVVSGGQRRDWLFSGPVAARLGVPHVSLYKDGRHEVVMPDGEMNSEFACDNACALHLVDLITQGSSVFRLDEGVPKGWVPILRGKGYVIDKLLAVVTRKQGGEELLAEQGVAAHPFVAIDEQFVRQYSKNPDRAVAYLQNPAQWSETYLRENGASALIGAFDPESGKLDRARRFLDRYGSVLEQSGRRAELDALVKEKYQASLPALLGNDRVKPARKQ